MTEKPEFKLGDKVTYKPYETEIFMFVHVVRPFKGFGPRVDLDIPEYGLGMSDGIHGGFHVTSYTTGRSIMESKHFEEYKDND